MIMAVFQFVMWHLFIQRLIINQQYRGKNRKELIIERLLDFNKVTIKLIDPNKLLSPTMCKEKNIRSIDEKVNI